MWEFETFNMVNIFFRLRNNCLSFFFPRPCIIPLDCLLNRHTSQNEALFQKLAFTSGFPKFLIFGLVAPMFCLNLILGSSNKRYNKMRKVAFCHSSILWLFKCMYVCVRVCECTHIYALYGYIYIYTHTQVWFSLFTCLFCGKKCSRELHNPISNCVGEVIFLIWVRTAKSSMRICDIDVFQMWEFLGLQLLAVVIWRLSVSSNC